MIRCVALPPQLTLVEVQYNARIDLDSILVFICVMFLHQIVKKKKKKMCHIFAAIIIQHLCHEKFKYGIHNVPDISPVSE